MMIKPEKSEFFKKKINPKLITKVSQVGLEVESKGAVRKNMFGAYCQRMQNKNQRKSNWSL